MDERLIWRLAAEAGWDMEVKADMAGTPVVPERLMQFAALIIKACRDDVLAVGLDADEAAKAKDAYDYVTGYQDAAVDCDESIRIRFGL